MNIRKFSIVFALILGLISLSGVLTLLDSWSGTALLVHAQSTHSSMIENNGIINALTAQSNISGTWTHDGVQDEWEQGTPSNTANGAPTHCASGPEGCWVTDLDANYNDSADENLYSPIITIPLSTSLPVSVTWQQGWYLEDAYYDHAYADYRCNSGAWVHLWQYYSSSNGNPNAAEEWQTAPGAPFGLTCGLTDTVQFRFRLTSDSNNDFPGYYVDDLRLYDAAGKTLYATEPPQISKAAQQTKIRPGDTVTYTLRLTNTRAITPTFTLTDTLDSYQKPLAVTASRGACSIADSGWGGAVTCAIPAMAVDESVTVTVTAQSSDMISTFTITNSAVVNDGLQTASDQTSVTVNGCFVRLVEGGSHSDYDTVQAAIDAASGSGSEVWASGLCGSLSTRGGQTQIGYISKTLTLRGGYNADFSVHDPAQYPTVLDSQGLGRVFYITTTATVENFTLTGGSGGYGGAVYADLGIGDAITFRANTIRNNTAGGNGGGIYVYGGYDGSNLSGQVTLIANQMKDNHASYGGAVSIGVVAQTTITRNTFQNNSVQGKGGALQVWGIADMHIADNTVLSNTAQSGGGGVYLDNGAYGALISNTIAYNRATAGDGGGVLQEKYANYTLENNAIFSNTASGNGGGIYALGDNSVTGPFRFKFNDIAYNHSTDGGGLYISRYACRDSSIMQGNLIRSNTASRDGGGLFIIDCEQLGGFINNALINNTAGNIGSGIRIHVSSYNGMNWTMVHTTIGNNTGGDGAGIFIGGGTADPILTNTLIYSQVIGVLVDGNGSNAQLDTTFWDNSVLTHTATSNGGTLQETAPLQGNAALSADGYHLTSQSPAINAGNSSVVISDDIDGQSRDDGRPDIGADEYIPNVDPSLTKTRQGSGNVEAGRPITYTLTVSNSAASEDQISVVLTDTITPHSAVTNVRFYTVGGDSCTSNATGFTCTVYNVTTNTLRTITAVFTTTASFEGILTNTAQLTTLTGSETNPANNSAGPVTVTVVAPAPDYPDLWVNKSVSDRYLQAGDTLTYTLQWGNQGNAAASSTVLTDTLPAKVNFISAEGTPARNGQILTWDLGNAASGAGGVYHVVVTAANGLADGTVLTNTVNIAGAGPELTVGNNTDNAASIVYAAGGISLTVTKDALGIVNDEVRVDDVVNYRIVISNSGIISTPFLLEDNIPQGSAYVDVWSEPPGAVYIANDNKIYWNHTAVLTVSTAVTVHLQVKVANCDGSNHDSILRNIAEVRVPDVSYVWQSRPRDLWVQCPNLAVDLANVHQRGAQDYLHYGGDYGMGENRYSSFMVYGNIDRGPHISLAASPRITLTLNGSAHFDPNGILPAPVVVEAQRIVWDLPELAPGETVDGLDENKPYFHIILDAYDRDGYMLVAEIGVRQGQEASWERDDNVNAELYPALTIDFEKQTLPPKVVWQHDASGNPTEAQFELGYQMLLHYRNSRTSKPQAYALEVADQWPPPLSLERHSGHLDSWGRWDFHVARDEFGNIATAYWEANRAIEGSRGWIRVNGYAPAKTNPPGETYPNGAALKFKLLQDGGDVYTGFYEESDQATAEVPLLQPLILQPQPGLQMCSGDTVQVTGIAQYSTTVKVYLNGVLQTTTQPNGLGTFTATVTTVAGSNLIEVSAVYQNEETGRDSVTVQSPGNLLWSPHGSSMMGTVTAGPQTGQVQTFDINSVSDFSIPGVYGLSNMVWTFRTCGCPRPATDVMSITVSADGGQYVGVGAAPGDRLSYAFAGLEHAHNVEVSAMCYDPSAPPPPKPGNPNDPSDDDANTQHSSGTVLIDPDGYVFDIDQGGAYDDALGGMFNPVQAVSGVTVTAYISVPTWGGWIPWPAHIYNQVNPQVTDDSYPDGITTPGYYAFYTPPGLYYLQVEGIPGYQEWRSPVIEVITQAVHVNVPYTPLPESTAVSVTLTAQGISSPVVTITVGSAVQWVSALTATDTITNLIQWQENPILHPRSALDPLLNPHGFDAGFLEPGRIYQRSFALPGVYAYTNAAGHNGKIIVTGGTQLYLPLVLRH